LVCRTEDTVVWARLLRWRAGVGVPLPRMSSGEWVNDDFYPTGQTTRLEMKHSSGAGGRHENMRAWVPEEDKELIELIKVHGKRWKEIAALLKPGDRTAAMVRNRWFRIQRGQALTKEGKSKNRCGVCGELKRGHICKSRTTIVSEGTPLVISYPMQDKGTAYSYPLTVEGENVNSPRVAHELTPDIALDVLVSSEPRQQKLTAPAAPLLLVDGRGGKSSSGNGSSGYGSNTLVLPPPVQRQTSSSSGVNMLLVAAMENEDDFSGDEESDR